jgi:hypothetical protein
MRFGTVAFRTRTWGIAILLLAIVLVGVAIALASAGTVIAGITYTGGT